MSVESVIGAMLSVEWLLGASMALAFERGVREVVNARLEQAAEAGEGDGESGGGRESGGN